MALKDIYVPDSQVLANQAAAKKLGIDIPGLNPTLNETPTSSRNLTPDIGGSAFSGLAVPDVQSAGEMMSEFGSVFAPQQNTIMGAYGQARSEQERAAAAQRSLIESQYGGKTEEEIAAGELGLNRAQEQQTGFAKSPIMLSLMASESEKRIRGLQRDKAELLMANDYEKASAISKLIVDEQSAITAARVNMLNEYFGFQGESRSQSQAQREALAYNRDTGLALSAEERAKAEENRAQLGFRTPEQTAVIEMSNKYPGSGITENDTLQSAQEKVRNSDAYKMDIRKGEADIAQSYAAMRASDASAAKTLSEVTPSTINGEVTPESAQAAATVTAILQNYGSISGGWQSAILPFVGDKYTQGQYEQLKSILSLGARKLIKGSGAISDFEARTLERSTSSLSRAESEDDFKQSLLDVQGVLRQNAGLPVNVRIMKDGKEVDSGLLYRDAVYDAAMKGYQVIYQ